MSAAPSAEACCARCQHPVRLHGRRGHGACAVGSVSHLGQVVEALRAAVLRGEKFDGKGFRSIPPCPCKRACKRAPRPEASGGAS
jgi:hypothetical protein